ncbi:uncharacterized protein DS421_18g604350 [Arachis hypogaea]|nr:uncharacterized protein DS421_18g604350 [Arachis hypogaea]
MICFLPMGKNSSPHMMKSMIVLMQWDYKKIFSEAYMLMVLRGLLQYSKGNCSFLQRFRCDSAGSIWNWQDSNILFWNFAAA